MSQDRIHQLEILEVLANEPSITQADLAARVGVAVGTVNWHLTRWTKKGLIKIQKINHWRWNYILTPKGIAEKTRLAGKYIETSLRIYRRVREQSRSLLEQVQSSGHSAVILEGDGELLDICRLTCLEMGLEARPSGEGLPVIAVVDNEFTLRPA